MRLKGYKRRASAGQNRRAHRHIRPSAPLRGTTPPAEMDELEGRTPLERAVLMLMERVGGLEERLAASESDVQRLGNLAAMQESGEGWAAAQREGRLDILDLLLERPEFRAGAKGFRGFRGFRAGAKGRWGFRTALVAGRTDVLRWADERGLLEFDRVMYYWLAGVGDGDDLEWLRGRGCPPCEHACTHAAYVGRTEAIRHLRAREPPFPWMPCEALEGACVKGHLETAQLVYSEAARAGEPIGEPHMRAVLAKMGHSHPDVRSWLLDRLG